MGSFSTNVMVDDEELGLTFSRRFCLLELNDAFPSSLLDSSWVQVSQTSELSGTQGTFPALSTKRGRGTC